MAKKSEFYNNYRVKSIEESHLEELVHLSNISTGEGYFDKDYFLDYLEAPQKHSLIYSINKTPVGFSLLELVSIDKFFETPSAFNGEMRRSMGDVDSLVVRRATSVHPNHRRKGIANDMVQRSLKIFNEAADAMVSIAWKSTKGVHMRWPLENNNFRPILEMKNFYYELSISRNFICPICGDPPCKCDAILYMKRLR